MEASTVAILLFTLCSGFSQDMEGGSINDLFTGQESEYYSDRFIELKDSFGLDKIVAVSTFNSIEKALRKQLDKIQAHGSQVIPVTHFEKIRKNGGRLPENVAKKVKKRGVLIVRNTISPELVQVWMADLVKYLWANNAFPKASNQTIYEVYWSKSQVAARQHPHMLAVQKALLELWHTNAKPVTYVDRLRIRQPNDSVFALPPHVDGGGIERWQDSIYRQVYRHITDGNWGLYDPFEADFRSEASMNDLGYANGCTFFRAFQGWLSMSSSEPGHGTLKVLPNLKESTAYWYLRPFLADVPEGLFPGCFPRKTFHVSKKWHDLLHDSLISIPKVNPGDTVWWHPDLIHAVESQHLGEEPNCVLYIPAGADCKINRDYLRKMRHSFILGTSPPDFPENNYEVDYANRASLDDLTNAGRAAMGIDET